MLTKATLVELYRDNGLSMAEVARVLGATHATVLYWLKRHGVARRSWSESSYVKLNPNGDPFRIKQAVSASDRELSAAALALYWAEGNKSNGAVRIGNLDAGVLRLFARFLREVGGVEEDRLSIYVRVNRPFSLKPAQRYWARQLDLQPRQVHVYRHTDHRSNPAHQTSP